MVTIAILFQISAKSPCEIYYPSFHHSGFHYSSFHYAIYVKDRIFQKSHFKSHVKIQQIEPTINRAYGVATIAKLLKIIGLFCKISSLLWGSFAKETCNFKEPTNRSHTI